MRDRENIPVMVLGLKRDLRKEEEGVIYPQEVGIESMAASAPQC